jgi:Bacterial SH3 domain
MSRVFCILMFVFLHASLAAAQSAVVARNVNIRPEASTNGTPVAKLAAGTPVELLDPNQSNGFFHVKTTDGLEGWAWSRNLHVRTKNIPTANTITAAPASKAGPDEIYPDALRTPGAANPDVTQENIGDNICNKDWATGSIRPKTSVTDPIKIQTMSSYGFTDAKADYELDHLISLQVGGCPTCVTNLWPEAYGDRQHHMTQQQRAAWNRSNANSTDVLPGSLEKDMVENHVHDEICRNVPDAKLSTLRKKFPPKVSITLKRGQDILATDWYSCYLNMMDGNKPCD